MSRRHWVASAGGAVALLAAGSARAQDANLVANLAPLISKSCTAVGDERGTISATRLRAAIFSKNVVTFDDVAPLVGTGGAPLATLVLAAADGDNQEAYLILGRLVESWVAPDAPGAGNFLPFASGGVAISRRDGAALASSETAAVLADIVDQSDARFVFRCTPPGETPDPAPESGRMPPFKLIIAKEPDDLALPKLTDRPFAEAAYVRDADAGEETFSFYGTLGLNFGDRAIGQQAYRDGRSPLMLRLRPIAFAQLEYEKVSGTGAAKTDNLNFGLELGGDLQTRTGAGASVTANHFLSLSLRYLTDTRFDSSGWSVVAKWAPRLPIPGSFVPAPLGDAMDLSWKLTGVFDHAGFEDPGRKTELLTAPHFTRVGLDAIAALRLKLGNTNIVTLSGEYAFREKFGSGPGDAQLLGLRMTFAPSDHFSFGIGYDRGENLDTLEHSDTLKLTIGVRQ